MILSIIRKILNHVKIKIAVFYYLHINYPYKYRNSKVLSVIPPDLIINDDVIIEKGVNIDKHLKSIGRHTLIANDTYITNCKSIGNFCSISFDVKIGLMSHPTDFISTSPVFYAPRRGWVDSFGYDEQKGKLTEIGHDVLISANVCIINGVKIGTGSIIGAGAVVTKDVPPYAIVAGVPAKIIRYRFDEETRKILLASEWWQKKDEELKPIISYANDPVKFISSLNL